MDGIRENEAAYGGTDYTQTTKDEYKCHSCNKTFAVIETGDKCPLCNSADWEYSRNGVGFTR